MVEVAGCLWQGFALLELLGSMGYAQGFLLEMPTSMRKIVIPNDKGRC